MRKGFLVSALENAKDLLRRGRYKEACEKFVKSANEDKNAEAMFVLGVAYSYGGFLGITQNRELSLWYFERAFEIDIQTKILHSTIHKFKDTGGTQFHEDVFKDFAKNNNMFAQYYLGKMFIKYTSSRETGLMWMEKSAMQGFSLAQENMGHYLLDGKKTYEWYKKAALQGNDVSQRWCTIGAFQCFRKLDCLKEAVYCLLCIKKHTHTFSCVPNDIFKLFIDYIFNTRNADEWDTTKYEDMIMNSDKIFEKSNKIIGKCVKLENGEKGCIPRAHF
jgi:hypothetical protein